jgi:ribonuclease BN (tRNA processing enzyme)
MRLLILGKSPSWQDAGGACSGYLLQDAQTTVLIDCGSGVFSKLRRYADYARVDAIVISHLHADHFLDLIPYAYGLTHTKRPIRHARPRLLVPDKGYRVLKTVAGAWGGEHLIDDAFAVEEYTPHSQPKIGPLEFYFASVPHFVDSYAMSVSSQDSSRWMTYGSDCGPSPALIDLAKGSDLLLLEATLPEIDRSVSGGHLTPRQAGEHAQAADAGLLVLTHISDELDLLSALNDARAAFGGPVALAREGQSYDL